MIHCDLPGCVRGVVHDGDWGRACMYCGGSGQISVREVARRIGEHHATLTRLEKPEVRMRPATGERLLDKLLTLIHAAEALSEAEKQVA